MSATGMSQCSRPSGHVPAGPYKDAVDTILEQDPTMPRRQRHTIQRIWQRLVDEHNAEVSYGMVCDYVARRRRPPQADQPTPPACPDSPDAADQMTNQPASLAI
jgi:hypothetical protein